MCSVELGRECLLLEKSAERQSSALREMRSSRVVHPMLPAKRD